MDPLQIRLPDKIITIHRANVLISRSSVWIASEYILMKLVKCSDAGTYSLVDQDGYVGTLAKIPEVLRGNCPVERCICGDRKSVYCKEAVVRSNLSKNGTMEKSESSGVNWFEFISNRKKKYRRKRFKRKTKPAAKEKKLSSSYRKSAHP